MAGKVTYSQLGSYGRLGNSLFQMANCIAYSSDHGKDLVFPKWKYADKFLYPIEEGELRYAKRHAEPHFHYSPIPLIDGDVDFHPGYYQSEKYFLKHEAEVRGALTLNKEYQKKVLDKFMSETMDWQYLKGKCPKPIIAIHVRRGDYETNHQTKAFHGVLGMDYYKRAIRVMCGEYGHRYCLFYIFSDDMDWCRANFNYPNMLFSGPCEDIVDMYTMARCDDFIIGNSSFSWWGAWLCEDKEKHVIAPKNWFTEKAGLDTQDLIPESWIRI